MSWHRRCSISDLRTWTSGGVGPKRQLTKAIARWAYERDYRGLACSSRFDATFTCWAILEGVAFEPIGPSEPILPNDPDLIATANLFRLNL